MFANLLKRSFSSDRNLTNQFRKYGQFKSKIYEKRRSIIGEIEQDLKSIAYLSQKAQTGEQGIKASFLHLEHPLFYMVNKNAAQKIHKELQIENQLLSSIKNLFESNQEDHEIIQKIFILTRNPLFLTQQIQAYLIEQLNIMLQTNQFQLFTKCIQGNKKFIKPFLPNLKHSQHLNIEEILNPDDQIEMDLEEDQIQSKSDDLLSDDFKKTQKSTVEENQNASQYKNLLDNQWEDQNINYHESNIIKGLQTDDSNIVVLQDCFNQDIKYQITNQDFLKLAEIEFSNNANSHFHFLVRKMEDESNLYAFYLILKSYDDSILGEAKDDVSICNFIKRLTTIQPEQFLVQLIKDSLLVHQDIQVDNLLSIIQRVRNIDIKFSLSCLKQLLTLKGDSMLIEDIVSTIATSSQLIFNSQYNQDQQLEELIVTLIKRRIFSNLGLDVLNLKTCFFHLLKLCNGIKQLKLEPQTQETIIEMSLQLYGNCFHVPEEEQDKEEGQIQVFKDIPSVEKFARCVQIISKGQQSDISFETKMLFKTFIENLLIQQVYKQSNIILYQLMDILVNTSLLHDIPKFSLLNNYVKSHSHELFSLNRKEASEKLQQTQVDLNNSKKIVQGQEIDFDLEEDTVQNNIQFSPHYQVCSYLRFASKYKFIKDLDLDFIEEIVSTLPKNDVRSYIYLYESILSNHSHWMMEDTNKLETFLHLQDICHIILKNAPYQPVFPISLCITLRNYLTFNNMQLKQYSTQIVDLSQYKPTNILKLSKSKQFRNNNEQKEDSSDIEIDSLLTKQINFPFNIDLIKKISPVNKNLKLFLNQYILEESSEAILQKKKKYFFDQIEYQINSDYPNPSDLFEIIRTHAILRKQIQQNPNHFSVIKKYTNFLLKGDFRTDRQPNLQKDKQENVEGIQSNEQKESSQKNLTIEQQQYTQIMNNKNNGEGDKVFSEILFFVRMCQEQQSRCFDSQTIIQFIENNVDQMDFTALIFSKQYINTANIRDPRVHSAIQKRIIHLIKPEHINLKNSLNMLKAFSLEDFDEKTLFLLENEIINKLNLINLTNLAVLFKKYFYKARWNPIRIVSGVSQNAQKYLSQINDQSYWMFLFLNKFKPSTLSQLKLEEIQFDKESLSSEYLLKFIQLFIEHDLAQVTNQLVEYQRSEDGFNQSFYDSIDKEREEFLKQIFHRREILAEKITFFLNKNPFSNEKGFQFQKDMLQMINTNKYRPLEGSDFSYEFLSIFYYFQIGEQKDFKISITPQHARTTINNLFSQFKDKHINSNQLIHGFYMLNEMNRGFESSFFTYKDLSHLQTNIIEDNKAVPLSETTSLTNIMRLYFITQSFIEKQYAKLEEDQPKILSSLVSKNFIFYKLKRNECKSSIISWINLIAYNKRNKQHNEKSKELINYFNGSNASILDKLETIFMKRCEFMETNDTLEIYNAYFTTELCSFQTLEACDKFLKENTARQIAQQQRVQQRQDHHDVNKRIAIPHTINHQRKPLQI